MDRTRTFKTSVFIVSFIGLYWVSRPDCVSAQKPIALQPFANEVRDLETTLDFLGQPLSPDDQAAINRAFASRDEAAALAQAELVLDKYTLVAVTINPESRVNVQ